MDDIHVLSLDKMLPADQPQPIQSKGKAAAPEVEDQTISPAVAIGMIVCISVATLLVMFCLFARSGYGSSGYGKRAKPRNSFKWVIAPVEPGGKPCLAVRVWLPEGAQLALPDLSHLAGSLPKAAGADSGAVRKPEAAPTQTIPSPPDAPPPMLPKIVRSGASKELAPSPPESPSKACVGIGIPAPPETLPPMMPNLGPQGEVPHRVHRQRASSAPLGGRRSGDGLSRERTPACKLLTSRAAELDVLALMKPPVHCARSWSQSGVEARGRPSSAPQRHPGSLRRSASLS